MNHKNFLIIPIGVQFAATLINYYGIFTNPTLSTYFYYAIMSALLTVITAAFYLKQTMARPPGIYSIPLVTFGLLTIYHLVQPVFIAEAVASVPPNITVSEFPLHF